MEMMLQVYLASSAALCTEGLRVAVERYRSGGRIAVSGNRDEIIALVWTVVSVTVTYSYPDRPLILLVAGGFVLTYLLSWVLAAVLAPHWIETDDVIHLPHCVLITDILLNAVGLVLSLGVLVLVDD